MSAATDTVTLEDGDRVISAEDRERIADALLLGLAYLGEFQKAEIAFNNYRQINGERPNWFDLRGHDDGDGLYRMADVLRLLQ
jgi:hypothetical protein